MEAALIVIGILFLSVVGIIWYIKRYHKSRAAVAAIPAPVIKDGVQAGVAIAVHKKHLPKAVKKGLKATVDAVPAAAYKSTAVAGASVADAIHTLESKVQNNATVERIQRHVNKGADATVDDAVVAPLKTARNDAKSSAPATKNAHASSKNAAQLKEHESTYEHMKRSAKEIASDIEDSVTSATKKN
jgi:hypothetical protein